MSRPWNFFPNLSFIDQDNKLFNPREYFEWYGDEENGGWLISFFNKPYKIVYKGKKYDEIYYRIADKYFNNVDLIYFSIQDSRNSSKTTYREKNPEKTKDFNNIEWNTR